MKEKIIARLRALFPGVNLSNTRLDAIADKLKVTEEAEIDPALKDLDAIVNFADLAKSDDYQRTKAQKEKTDKEKADKDKADKEKADKEKADKDEADKKKAEEGKDPEKIDLAALVKEIKDSLQKEFEPLKAELEGLKKGKVSESRQTQFKEKIKDAPELFKKTALANYNLLKDMDDEQFTEYLTTVEGQAKEFTQTLANSNLALDGSPLNPNVPTDEKLATPAEALSILKGILPNQN